MQKRAPHFRELFCNSDELIERKGFERLTLKVGVGTGLTEQITAISDFDKDDSWSPVYHCPAQIILRKAILDR